LASTHDRPSSALPTQGQRHQWQNKTNATPLAWLGWEESSRDRGNKKWQRDCQIAQKQEASEQSKITTTRSNTHKTETNHNKDDEASTKTKGSRKKKRREKPTWSAMLLPFFPSIACTF
jgi:hypothetical protein